MTANLPLFDWLKRRAAGLLLHPVSLPGPYGVGTLGAAAFRLVDFLKEARMSYWQILPLGPTGYGDSPYSSFSAFAGNPYLVDLQPLLAFGLLTADDLVELDRLPAVRVDYGALYTIKWPVLRLAFQRFREQGHAELPGYGSFAQFKAEHKAWLDPFALFMALKAQHGGHPWYEWEPKVRTWARACEQSLPETILEQAEAQRFYQYLFFAQWNQLRAYATRNGVSIVGDVPIFVSRDSADLWSEPEVFHLDSHLMPPSVAGVPPDYFSPDGQLWGNPLYNWEHLKASGYDWWMRRLAANFAMLDVVRLDHFRGFAAYWSVPASAPTPAKARGSRAGPRLLPRGARALPQRAHDCRGPGRDRRAGLQARRQHGPARNGRLQFAFDAHPENIHLPHNMRPNQVLYPGTHDNDTTRGWYAGAGALSQDQLRRYFRVNGADVAWDFVRACYGAVPRLAVVTAQDLLALGSEARMTPPAPRPATGSGA
jgi:4-alpha-glucanotransferase